MVRLLLEKLGNANKAFSVVRKTKSPAAVALVASHCLSRSNWDGAIEFLILAGKREEAWEVAQTHGVVDIFMTCLGSAGDAQMHVKAALYYQNAGKQQLVYIITG